MSNGLVVVTIDHNQFFESELIEISHHLVAPNAAEGELNIAKLYQALKHNNTIYVEEQSGSVLYKPIIVDFEHKVIDGIISPLDMMKGVASMAKSNWRISYGIVVPCDAIFDGILYPYPINQLDYCIFVNKQ